MGQSDATPMRIHIECTIIRTKKKLGSLNPNDCFLSDDGCPYPWTLIRHDREGTIAEQAGNSLRIPRVLRKGMMVRQVLPGRIVPCE
jgi:hypothetical protein